MSTLRALPGRAVREQDVLVPYKTGGKTRNIAGRLCMMRLPEAEARKARNRVRKEQGAAVSAETLEAAAYVVLFTTVPRERLSAAQCIELYRLRWQIELQFKRWKSICGFDRMPNFKPETITAWLYAKLLAAVLLEKLTSLHSEVFPPIDYEDETLCSSETTLEDDPTAVAIARLRTLADEAMRVASRRRVHC